MIQQRYTFRSEQWGGLALDCERDRIWAFDSNFYDRVKANPDLIGKKTGELDPFCYDGDSCFGEFPNKSQFTLTAPISVSWTVTNRCQSACIFCCTNSHMRAAWGADLPTIKNALDKLARWGVLRLIAGGGEPLIRDDIEPILEHAHLRGLSPALATNGFLLDQRMAERLAPFVMQFQISLDSVRPDEYAALRGKAGGPHLALDAIEHAAQANRNVRVVTVLNARNIHRLDEIAHAVNESSASQWFLFVVQPSGRGARMYNKLKLTDYGEVRRRVSQLKSQLRNDLAVCFWGDNVDDGIAVYLTEDCSISLKDYCNNTSVELDNSFGKSTTGDFHHIWSRLDVGAKYATLKNFVSPNRTI